MTVDIAALCIISTGWSTREHGCADTVVECAIDRLGASCGHSAASIKSKHIVGAAGNFGGRGGGRLLVNSRAGVCIGILLLC